MNAVLCLSLLLSQEPQDVSAPSAEVEQAGGFSSVLAETEQTLQQEGVSVVFRGVGESWDDETLERLYRGEVFMGSVGLVVPLHRYAVVDIEAGFKRQGGSAWNTESDTLSSEGIAFQLVPVSALVEARYPLSRGSLFAGVGPSMAVFQEEFPATENAEGLTKTQVSGAKLGAELRMGLRMSTGFQPQRPLPPAPQPLIQGISVEFYGGRRMQRAPSGFDLAAWRLSAGVAVQF